MEETREALWLDLVPSPVSKSRGGCCFVNIDFHTALR